MHIRSEVAADIPAIRELIAEAFGQHQEAELFDRLRHDGDLIVSLVAEDDTALIGHVAFANLRSPPAALALAPVSVLPQRQRQGVGSALIRHGLAEAAAKGYGLSFVVGEPSYYQRFGFSLATAAPYPSPYAGPYFMATSLGGAPAMPMPVVYPDAFAGLT